MVLFICHQNTIQSDFKLKQKTRLDKNRNGFFNN